MAAIGKAEDTFVQFESNINVHAIFAPVGTLQQFFVICKPKKLAVGPEMHWQQPAIQNEKYVLAFATDSANAPALAKAGNVRGGLRLRGYRVKDMNATDQPPSHQRTERANDCFHFRQFRHRRRAGSSTGLEPDRGVPGFRFASIATLPPKRLA